MPSNPPALFPTVHLCHDKLSDGRLIPCSAFCRKSFSSRQECASHYEKLKSGPTGIFQCPFGFTTRTFDFEKERYAITGVIAFPRFGTPEEAKMAKRFPENKVTRLALEEYVGFIQEVEQVRASEVEAGAKVLPQKMHELRKLNGAILQHSEKELKRRQDSPALQSIHSAAELMKNNFDILEALANPDSMRALPLNDSINLFDLSYKMKKVYEERARTRNITIRINGDSAIINGSYKSFPIVPAVLMENAIKYSTRGSEISITIARSGRDVVVDVENTTDLQIDSEKCFEKGVRFAKDLTEGAGFGLFLARQIAEAHGGSITCFANAGIVCMSVRLPLVKVLDDRRPFR